MAEKINDGGPVFPCEIGTTSKGMTLRDYLAAKAMEVDYTLAKNFTDPDWRYNIALDAYRMADAMLKARASNAD